MPRFFAPMSVLKTGDRFVCDGDGFFWKTRWVVDKITNEGVVSHCESFVETQQKYVPRENHPTIVMKHDGRPVHMDSSENPDFDFKTPYTVRISRQYARV